MINGVFGVNIMSGISGVSSYGRYGSYGAYSAYGFYGSARTAETSRMVRTQPVQRTGAVPVVRRASDIGTPVEPVRPIKAVNANATNGVGYAIPFLRKGMDPAELAVRMRIHYGDESQAEEAKTAIGRERVSDAAANADADLNAAQGAEGVQKAANEGECKTCEQRKYQDGSNDAGVSYKSPTHIAPEQAAAAVRGHEMEHVVREQAKAVREGREVVSQSVTMHTSVCPECGKVYVSGGTTRTTTAESQKPETAEPEEKEQQRIPFSAVA